MTLRKPPSPSDLLFSLKRRKHKHCLFHIPVVQSINRKHSCRPHFLLTFSLHILVIFPNFFDVCLDIYCDIFRFLVTLFWHFGDISFRRFFWHISRHSFLTILLTYFPAYLGACFVIFFLTYVVAFFDILVYFFRHIPLLRERKNRHKSTRKVTQNRWHGRREIPLKRAIFFRSKDGTDAGF